MKKQLKDPAKPGAGGRHRDRRPNIRRPQGGPRNQKERAGKRATPGAHDPGARRAEGPTEAGRPRPGGEGLASEPRGESGDRKAHAERSSDNQQGEGHKWPSLAGGAERRSRPEGGGWP